MYSKLLFFSSISLVSGIFLSSIVNLPRTLGAIFLVFGFSLIIAFLSFKKEEKAKRIVFFGILIIFLAIGLLRHAFFKKTENISFEEKNVVTEGIIINSPEQKPRSDQFILESDEKRILVITEKYSGFNEGDIVLAEGKVEIPQRFDGFDYPGYLAQRNIYHVMFYPRIDVIGHQKSLTGKIITDLREKAEKTISRRLPSPHSSLLEAMVLGNKGRIPEKWQEKLNIVGARHITAVSGLHITVVSVILTSAALATGINKRAAFLATGAGILFFIAIIGFQPSAIRAGIMGSCLILSKITGRMNNSLRALLFAAGIMLFLNPLLLTHNIGFQLSFAASMGIIFFSPFFRNIFKSFAPWIKDTLSVSFSAHILAFPIMGYHFGEISLMFPLTNILILPALYWTMLFGLLLVVFSLIAGFLEVIIFLPVWALLSYIVFVVNLLSQASWASVNYSNFFLLSYLFMLYSALKLLYGRKRTEIEIEY